MKFINLYGGGYLGVGGRCEVEKKRDYYQVLLAPLILGVILVPDEEPKMIF